MFIAIGILFFLAWLASSFFFIGHIATYTVLLLAIFSIVIHFSSVWRRYSDETVQP